MGKGIRDKQTGFWMYMQQFVKPELEQKFGRRLSATDLVQFGLPHWSKLSFEEKEEWREKAKEYNRSDERQNRRLLNCEYHQRRHEADQPEDSAQSYRSRKLKPSKIVPPSRRYDEVDQYTRKYFAGVDDFEVKRENDRREFIDRYQWKFAGKDLASKKEFFHESEIILATVNVYYEDNLNEQMIPSEISILKCSIKRGIYDHRHYILGFAKNGILCKNYEAEAEKNEQMTGLLMDCDKMPANVRFDYAQIWNEIKAFTRIDGDSVKLLLPSKSWNAVVGSFDALFVYANEKSFSRIESRFATMEDYFMAVYTTVHDIPVNDEIKSDVVIEMNEVWHCALFFDSMACDFHAGLKSTKHSQARNCSLFTAHKTAFSFFTLCNKHVFLACELTERHILNEGLLSTAENDCLENRSQQQPHFRLSIPATDYSLVENIRQQSILPLLPKKRTLKSNMMKKTAAACDGGTAKSAAVALERTRSTCNALMDNEDSELGVTNHMRFAERWLHNQPSLPTADMDFSWRNPHVFDASSADKHCSPVDAIIGQQSISSQFTSVSAHRSGKKNPLYLGEGLKANFAEIDVVENQKPSSSSTNDKEFSNVMTNGSLNKISSCNEKKMFVDLSLTGDDSDAELFCDASIPCSSLYGKGYLTQKPQKLIPRVSESYQNDWFLKTTNKVKQTSASPCKEMGATHNIESVPKPCNSQPVSTCNYGPVCVKSGQMFSKVKQNRSISSKGSMECDLNLSSYPLKTCKSPSSSENLIPERTSGGFCIPSIYQTNSSCGRKNRPTTSASYGETGSEQKNTSQKSEMVANRMITRRNPHCSDQSLARHQQKEKEAEVTTGKSQHQSFSCFTQPLFANTTEEYRRTIQNADIMKPFTLEPLICEKAETFGWSENARCVPDEKFTRWLNSAYFEISGSNTESDYRKTR